MQRDADGSTDVERSAIQLVSRLPDETLCRLLASREVSQVGEPEACAVLQHALPYAAAQRYATLSHAARSTLRYTLHSTLCFALRCALARL